MMFLPIHFTMMRMIGLLLMTKWFLIGPKATCQVTIGQGLITNLLRSFLLRWGLKM